MGGDECPPAGPTRNATINIYGRFNTSLYIYGLTWMEKIVGQLTDFKGYDAETTYRPDGKNDLYQPKRRRHGFVHHEPENRQEKESPIRWVMMVARQFNPDGKKIIRLAFRPKTETEIKSERIAGWVWWKSTYQYGRYGLLMQMEAISNKITHLVQIAGRRYLCRTTNELFLLPTTNTKGFPFNMYIMNRDGNNLQESK